MLADYVRVGGRVELAGLNLSVAVRVVPCPTADFHVVVQWIGFDF